MPGIRAALCALMVLVMGPAHAETYKIENIGTGDLRGATDGLSFTYDVHLRLELLLGEPVVGTRFRWRLNPNFSEVEVSELVTGERRRVKLLNLPREAQLKARIYDVDIEFEMSGASGVVYLLADGGDPGPGDGETWSFNVPGSPDWSEMFYRTPLDGPDDRADYVSETEAKRIWQEGLRLHTARLVDVKVSTHDLVRWYVKQSKAPEVAVTQKAIRNLAEGVREGFGYDLDADEFAEVTPEDRWDTEGMSGLPEEEGLRSSEIDYQILSDRLGKLLAMPKKFEPKGELILFDAAVAELRSDIAALAEQRTERGLRDYPLKLGLSPREFEEGHDVRAAGNSYELVEDDGAFWVADLSGEEVYYLGYGELLFAKSVVTKTSKCRLELFNPKSEEVVFENEFDCNSWIHFVDVDKEAPPAVERLRIAVHTGRKQIVKRYVPGTCSDSGQSEVTVYDVEIYELGTDLELKRTGSDRHRHVTKRARHQFCLSTW
ncbi:hypothetical protein A3731_12355 [Roseovarius sp. HI0049]|nr:hypothetical protein A3731_12355 [Roseovarius sp. HI0049]